MWEEKSRGFVAVNIPRDFHSDLGSNGAVTINYYAVTLLSGGFNFFNFYHVQAPILFITIKINEK